jgi:putative transposase
VSEARFYNWRKKFGSLDIVSGMREMRQLREEKVRLKLLVADLTLDKHILEEVLRKNA